GRARWRCGGSAPRGRRSWSSLPSSILVRQSFGRNAAASVPVRRGEHGERDAGDADQEPAVADDAHVPNLRRLAEMDGPRRRVARAVGGGAERGRAAPEREASLLRRTDEGGPAPDRPRLGRRRGGAAGEGARGGARALVEG